METSGRKADATFECSPSDSPGIVELWDGDLAILRTDFGVE